MLAVACKQQSSMSKMVRMVNNKDHQNNQKDERDQDDQDYEGDVEAPHDVVHIVVARLNLGLRGDCVQPGQ